MRLFSVISRTLVRGGLTHLPRCSRCILLHQLTGPVSNGFKILLFKNHNHSFSKFYRFKYSPTKLAGPVEYTDCISAKE